MNVSCPKCATTYRVDPAKVPAAGVVAKCARCPKAFRVEPVRTASTVEGLNQEVNTGSSVIWSSVASNAGIGEATRDEPGAEAGDQANRSTDVPAGSETGTNEPSTLSGASADGPTGSIPKGHDDLTNAVHTDETDTIHRESAETDDLPYLEGTRARSENTKDGWAADGAPTAYSADSAEEVSGWPAGEPEEAVAPASSNDPVMEGGSDSTPSYPASHDNFSAPASGSPLERETTASDPGLTDELVSANEEGSAASDGAALSPPPFGAMSDPHRRATRLARALVSDIVVYHPDRRARSLRQGTLRQEFREEIRKSWEEYANQVGGEFARQTSYFRDALNDILADGATLF